MGRDMECGLQSTRARRIRGCSPVVQCYQEIAAFGDVCDARLSCYPTVNHQPSGAEPDQAPKPLLRTVANTRPEIRNHNVRRLSRGMLCRQHNAEGINHDTVVSADGLSIFCNLIHGRHRNRTKPPQPLIWEQPLPLPVGLSVHTHCSSPFRVIFVTWAELHSSYHDATLHPITPLYARHSSVHIRAEAQRRRQNASY
jgi:hypothetical protein